MLARVAVIAAVVAVREFLKIGAGAVIATQDVHGLPKCTDEQDV